MPEIFFHVGLGKTASTYLQYAFFPKLKGINYIQRTRYGQSKELIRKQPTINHFVSREFDQQLEQECQWFSADFPEARTIIILRRQDGWVASQYRRYVKNGGSLSFREFFDVSQDKGYWHRKDAEFFPMLQILEQYFQHPPLVLFHEDLKKDPYGFFDAFAAYLGATYDREEVSLKPIHRSYSEKQLKVIRKVGKYIFSQDPQWSSNKVMNWIQRRSRLYACYVILYPSLLIPDFLVSSEPLITQEELAEVRDFYAADWEACRAYAQQRKGEME